MGCCSGLQVMLFSRRKRGEKGEVVETVEDVIVRKLTAERIEELKRLIRDTQEKHRYVEEETGLAPLIPSAEPRPLRPQEAKEGVGADPSRTPGLQAGGAMGGHRAVRHVVLPPPWSSGSGGRALPHCMTTSLSHRKGKQEEEEAELKRKTTDAAYQGTGHYPIILLTIKCN